MQTIPIGWMGIDRTKKISAKQLKGGSVLPAHIDGWS
jgi:hypothetical protein